VVDNSRVAEETKTYQEIPDIMDFVDENGNDRMQWEIENNYRQIKQDIKELIENEMERIKNDDGLKHLVKEL
jgi:predicted transcriptional regulator